MLKFPRLIALGLGQLVQPIPLVIELVWKFRLAERVQLSTDGWGPYIQAVGETFGVDIDYAQLVTMYGEGPRTEARYNPAVCTGIRKRHIEGKPDMKEVSTSYVERSNLSMRMHNRRFTRLTNAHS